MASVRSVICILFGIFCTVSSTSCSATTHRHCPYKDTRDWQAGYPTFSALELRCLKLEQAFGGESGVQQFVKTFEVDPSQVDSSATVPSQLRALFIVFHPRPGDLSATLEHEGKIVELFTAQTSSADAERCTTSDIGITFKTDVATAPTIDGSTCSDMGYNGKGYSGVHRAHGNGLEEFVGTSILGEWKLTMTDHFGGNTAKFYALKIFFEDDVLAECANGCECAADADPLLNAPNGGGGYSILEVIVVSFIASMAVIVCVALVAFIAYGSGYRTRNKYDGYSKTEMRE